MGANRDERELVAEARAGDGEAFGQLVRRHAPRLLRVADSILGDRSCAEDAVQDGVLQAWRALPGFRGDAAFGTWLYRIVVRCAVRRLGERATAESLDAIGAEARFADPDYTVDPAEVIARASHASQIRQALWSLPVVYRVAVVLHDVDGLTTADVARLTGVPLGTAKARLRRGRIALLAELTRSEGAAVNGVGCS